jgi:isocitrate dehydrogenase kinase/phosphatase
MLLEGPSMTAETPRAEQIAEIIHHAFDRYLSGFGRLTLGARRHFEAQDWGSAQQDWVARLDLYGRLVGETLDALRAAGGATAGSRHLWRAVKRSYRDRTTHRHGAELAETFFNSITRRVFTIVGVEADIEFLDIRPAACPVGPAAPVTRTVVRTGSVEALVAQVLGSYSFAPGYEDLSRDAAAVARRIEHEAPGADSVEMAVPIFFRNKGAYLVGRIRRRHASVPLVIALLNPRGRVAVDAVLTTEDEASIVFSFTRSYFFVDAPCPGELVSFLHGLMPRKPVAELYIAIGCNKHGKTELYRSLRQHLRTSSDRFDFARGARGMVMVVFSMPSYDVIFKVVRDHFAEPKRCTRRDVMEKYQLVFKHDRAGRLIDAQEFEYLRFDRQRFVPALLDELLSSAGETVSIEGESVVFRHLYTERRVTPLDIYLAEAGPDAAREAIVDYGQTLRDLAANNIFPGDLLLKNFGVTRHGRVVFYDYDELALLTDCHFRPLPVAATLDEELAGEPWFYVGDRDIFPEEFLPFLGLTPAQRHVFLAVHGDLLKPDFWQAMQREQHAGRVVDIFPYTSHRRLRAASSDSEDAPTPAAVPADREAVVRTAD